MDIVKVTSVECESVDVQGGEYTRYYRYSPNSWTVEMNLSDEPVLDCDELAELEAKYQEFKALQRIATPSPA